MNSDSKYAAFIILCEFALLFPSLWITPNLSWYASLVRPSWTIPSVLFVPIWLALGLFMGLSLGVLHRNEGWLDGPDGNFMWTVGANTVWSLVLFGGHDPFWGFVFSISLWVSTLIAVLSFLRNNKRAASLLVPYLVWVTIIAVFNYNIWILNR